MMSIDGNGRGGRIGASATGLIAVLALAGCATADRTGARRIADTGAGVAHALSDEVDGRQRLLRDAVADDSFNYAYSVMRHCAGITRLGAAAPVPDCDVLLVAAGQRRNGLRNSGAGLADILAKRAAAADALGQAYRTFGAEADYDAVADMESAVGQATAAVNGFAVAVGLGPLAPIAGRALTAAAGVGADRAQKQRLLAANAQLRALSGWMRAALLREQQRHRQIDAIVAGLGTETVANLVKAGLLDSAPAVRGVAERAGVPIVAPAGVQAAMARDPLLAAAADVTALARLPMRGGDALGAAIDALAALDAQHAAYARGRPVSAADAVAALSRLAAIARTGD